MYVNKIDEAQAENLTAHKVDRERKTEKEKE